MAISSTQYIDLLVKKLAGVAKTDTATNKGPSNENIPSPPLVRGDLIWVRAGEIPATAQVVSGLTQAYLTTSAVECDADTTTVPVSGVYPTWKTNLADWIPTEFGATWSVKVYVDDASAADPTSTGTEIFAAGSGGTGQYYFDHQAGVLNFIGETIPAALTSSKKIYIAGYRYIGTKTLTSGAGGGGLLGDLAIADNELYVTATDDNLLLSGNGAGIVELTGTAGFLPPVGTSAERPGTPTEGLTRYNSTNNLLEFYNGVEWVIAGPNAGEITSQTLTGDGSTGTFTLDNESTTAGIIVSINGIVQKPGTAYSVSGDQITFQETPLDGDIIDVRFITITLSFGDTALNVYTRTQTLSLSNIAEGTIVYVSDGDSGSPCLAVYDGSNWKKIALTENL